MDQELKVYFDQSFRQLREETAQQFQEVARQFQQVREETAQQFQQARQESDRQFQELRQDVRGAYVLIEDVEGRVRLVAEGVASVTEQLKLHDDKVSRELDEIRAFNRLSYQDLDTRMRNLETAN